MPFNIDARAEAFRLKLHGTLGRMAVAKLKRQPRAVVPRSIKRSLTYKATWQRVIINTPYYWAYYLHQGRKAMSHGNLIYFLRPEDDPRLAGGYPVRESDRKHLTRTEFLWFRKIQYELKLKGRRPVMIVTPYVKASRPRPFFYDGLRGFEADAQRVIEKEMTSFLRKLGKELSREHRQPKVTVRL